MEMRAVEDIGIAEDITPPLPPLAFCLHYSFLSTRCAACSLPLPIPNSPFTPTLPPNSKHALLYCSSRCSSLDSPLHFSSSEHNLLCQSPSSTCTPVSSNVRLSLRLRSLLLRERNDAVDLSRIGGLLTHYYEGLAVLKGNGEGEEDDDDVLGMIRGGAREMVLAGKLGGCDSDGAAAAMMRLVLTNAVEVLDKNGRDVGIAVYDTKFSWINHSCSPNACYRFTTEMTPEIDSNCRLRIYPTAMDGGATAGPAGDSKITMRCGPKIIVRSIKEIKKDEEVTIAYTDLLQPKAMRQSELQAKYQFNCCCKRCSATPATYVDRALQEIMVCNLDGHNWTSDGNFYRCNEAKKLLDLFDNALHEFLTFDNPETCCKKLEELLTQGYVENEQLKPTAGKSHQCISLHQFHHLSLNAYTTLASAYRVRASDLLASSPEDHKQQAEAFNMSRISAAYSLLLAVVTHHLFLAESSLIATVANFWKNAGESLVYLSRSSMWDTFQKLRHSVSENSLATSQRCYQVVQLDRLKANYFAGIQDQKKMFVEISRQFLNCIVNITAKVWNFLAQEGHHLNEIKDLIDFRGLLIVESSLDFETHLTCNCTGIVTRFDANEHPSQESMQLFQLGVHCLIYGAYISSICFGEHSQLSSDVVNFLYSEGILAG